MAIDNLNQPRYTGVTRHKASGRWWGRVKFRGESISLGYFQTAELANTHIRICEKQISDGTFPDNLYRQKLASRKARIKPTNTEQAGQ